MPSTTHITTRDEYFLLSSAAYAELIDAQGQENPVDKRQDAQGDAAYETLKASGWRLIHAASGKQGYRGYVFVHEGRKEICIAHRGTQNLGSIMTDILAVIRGNRTWHVIDAVNQTLGNAVVQDYLSKSDWTLSTTGHSLGGWLATLLQFVVSDIGMGFHFEGQVTCRTFDAPGIGEFLDKLQSDDPKQQVFIPGLDCINYVVRADAVNTLNRQTGTLVCVEGAQAETPHAVKDLIHIGDIHGRGNIQAALEKQDFKLIQQWPHTSDEVLAKLSSALSGSKLALLGVAVSATSSVVSGAAGFLKRLFKRADNAPAEYSDDEVKAARETLEKAMQENLRLLPYNYHQERQIRHLPLRLQLFVKAYQAFKNYSVMPKLMDKLNLTEAERALVDVVSIDKRAQAEWIVLASSQATAVGSLDDWVEQVCNLAIEHPGLFELECFTYHYYDNAAQYVDWFKKHSRLTDDRMQCLAEEIKSLKDNKVQQAVVDFGCARASGKDAFAYNNCVIYADDLEKFQKEAVELAKLGISASIMCASAEGEDAVAIGGGAVISISSRFSNEEIMAQFDKALDKKLEAELKVAEMRTNRQPLSQRAGDIQTGASAASAMSRQGVFAPGVSQGSSSPAAGGAGDSMGESLRL